MSRERELKEIFNPKNLKRKGDYSELIKIAELINKSDKAEVPNSATISMAMDSILGNGKIFLIKYELDTKTGIPKFTEADVRYIK
jgi:hypothetical protein